MDFMLVNGCIAWNMSSTLKGDFSTTLDNATWRMYVAKHMLTWKDPMDENESPKVLSVVIDNHLAKPILPTEPAGICCLVCGLETSIWESLGICMIDTCGQSSNHLAICLNSQCCISAHSHVLDRNKQFIFNIQDFHGVSCFQITYHELSKGLFSYVVNNPCNKIFQIFSNTTTKEIDKNHTCCVQ